MKKINKIFEGRGISDIIKQYSNIIYDSFLDGNYKIQLDFDYDILPLMDLRIILKKSNTNHGVYILDYSKIIDKKLYDVTIEIEYNDDLKSHIIGLITHELNHINEYYNIQIKMLNTQIKISPVWIDIQFCYKELNINENDPYYLFVYLLYLSLDAEMNARISQVYDYLLSFNIKDEKILFDKLKEHKNLEYVQMLNEFDYKEFIKTNIDNINENGLIVVTNTLIEKFKNKELNTKTKLLKFINKNVNNTIELYDFYEKFSEYFKIKTVKHIEKFKYIIKEVIEDLNGNRPYHESQRINKNMRFEKYSK
jgi:hypothetical protein